MQTSTSTLLFLQKTTPGDEMLCFVSLRLVSRRLWEAIVIKIGLATLLPRKDLSTDLK